ncbi:MAG TPA: cobalamin biosynthesis protein CobD [Desulfuromonadales bacterium]|nr:cobalamin biosynthesis protein CobD [Desulfuromonadales bacterium]
MTPPEPLIIVVALLLDLLIGDPRWFPHPVVAAGKLISALDDRLRLPWLDEKIAGVLLLVAVVGAMMGGGYLLLRLCAGIHPLAGITASVILCFSCLAVRSLHVESGRVAEALRSGDIVAARHNLSWIVGRDTDALDEPEIWRALVETVAENSSDGIIAPLFWLTLGGPLAALAFKGVSTLDSMVGYKNERYLQMGWASARMDDLLNFIPARLTALLMICAAPLAGCSARGAFRIVLRDRLKHPSPNSAHPEAAAAGALGVQLGGVSTYSGVTSLKEHIGDPHRPLDGTSYDRMIKLMYISTLLMAAACTGAAFSLRGFGAPIF